MKLLPYDKFEIETFLSPVQARKLIETIIVPKPSFSQAFLNALDNMFKKSGTDQFIGKLDDHGFRLTRVIYYRNSFLPIVKGRFEQGSVGTRLEVSMTLHPAITVFVLIWFIGVGTIGLMAILYMFLNNFHPKFLIPIAIFLLGGSAFKRHSYLKQKK